MENRVKAKVRVVKKIFYKSESDFGILLLSPLEIKQGKLDTDYKGFFTAKGTIPPVREGGTYELVAKESFHEKYGKQYDIVSMYTNAIIDTGDIDGKRTYLETVFTEKQVEALYAALPDPYETLLHEDVQALVTVKGIGLKNAKRMMAKFTKDIDNSKIYVELAEYELSSSVVKRLLEYYKSPDLVIKKVTDNPYSLMEVSGIGWKKCDELALRKGMDKYAKERVAAFILYYLGELAESGYTYVYSNSQLMEGIVQQLGEDIPDEPITEALHDLGKKLWISEDHERIGLSRYVNLEEKIAKKLVELQNAKREFHFEGWQEIVKEQEEQQGWEYTDQQKEAIQMVLENQVIMISGLAGCGKTTVVKIIMEILKDYDIKQCALAGKASARMAEVTGIPGYTIHRLLKYPSKEDMGHGGFFYNEDNFLPTDVVILDEISMVNGWLFYSLISALAPGTKLIMLGDVGQLESIGCLNIAHDLIVSPDVKSIELNKIHRQAANSAIITDSIAIRNGRYTIEKDWIGCTVHGNLQDLTYDCYSDINNTFYKVMQRVSQLIADGNGIMDFQVIVPNKDRASGTWNLNLAIQELCNPLPKGETELVVSYDKDHVGSLRVGDKVINVQNNYNSVTYEGQWDEIDEEIIENMGEKTPVFNGSIGVIEAINLERKELIVNFEGLGRLLITSAKLSSIMLGYAITVHKSQGSQAKYLVFGCDFSAYSLLTRELLYTAITRAQEHCYVIAQTKALRYAISQTHVSIKQTMLVEFLNQICHPKLTF